MRSQTLAPSLLAMLVLAAPLAAYAQPAPYQQIPNYVGVGAGKQFRQAINDRFSGAQPITPTISGGTVNANVNGVINVQSAPYGATGNSVTDDWPAIQGAIAAACGYTPPGQSATGPIGRPAVYIPGVPNGRYALREPLHLYCPYLRLYGAGWSASALSPQFIGPTVLVEPYGANNLTLGSASLVPGPGLSLSNPSPQGPTTPYLVLNDAPVMYLDNLGTFTVELFFELTGYNTSLAQVAFVRSIPALPATRATGAFMLGTQGTTSPVSWGQLTVNGSLINLPGLTTITLNTVHHMAMSYDSTEVRLYLDGNLEAANGASGNVTQGPFETITLPDMGLQVWPDQQQGLNGVYGYYDSIRFSDSARYTAGSFTPPSKKLTVDSNTMLLINFLPLCSSVTTATAFNASCSPDGTMLAQSGIDNRTIYLTVRGQQEGSVGPSAVTLDDLDLCGGAPGGGLFANWAVNSHFHDLRCSGGPFGTMAAFNLFDNDYETELAHTYELGGSYHTQWNSFDTTLGYELGNAANDNIYNDLIADGNQVGFMAYSGAATWQRPVVTDRGQTIYPFVLAGTEAVMNRPFVDSETPNSLFQGDMYLSGNWAPVTVIGGELDNTNNSPALVINGGAPATLINSTFAVGSAPELVNILAAPTWPVTLLDSALPAGVPLVNSAYASSVWARQGATVSGITVSKGVAFASFPTTVINGASFYCPSCDPPANPPVACTSAGTKTGSWVHGLNGAWICTP